MTPAGRAGPDPVRPDVSALVADRTLALACAGALAAINAEAASLITMIRGSGLFPAFAALGGVSAVVWFALFALIRVALDGPAERLRRADLIVLAIVILCAVLPIRYAAQAGLLLVALYLLIPSTADKRDRRAGLILLALTGPLLWGKIALNLFVQPLLQVDAQLVGLILNTPVDGNMLHFTNSARQFVVAGPCSSLHNMSLAVLLWAVAAALFELKPDRRLAAFGIAAILFMFTLNLARLAAIGRYPNQFIFLHDGAGAILFGWAALLGAGLIVGSGVNDAFQRRR